MGRPSIDSDTLAEVHRRADGVPGLEALVLVGSAARGEMLPHSDIDVMAVLRDATPWSAPVRDGGREVFFNDHGQQVELSYTSVARLGRRMREEAAAGRRARMDWAEEGIVLAGGGDGLEALRSGALALLAEGPPPFTGHERAWEIYDTWNALKDLMDATDEASAAILAVRPFEQLTRLFLRLSRTWEPRPRMLLAAIEEASPAFGASARTYLLAGTAKHRVDGLTAMASWLETTFGFSFDAPYESRGPQYS